MNTVQCKSEPVNNKNYSTSDAAFRATALNNTVGYSEEDERQFVAASNLKITGWENP